MESTWELWRGCLDCVNCFWREDLESVRFCLVVRREGRERLISDAFYGTRVELFSSRFCSWGAIAGFVVPVGDLWKWDGFFGSSWGSPPLLGENYVTKVVAAPQRLEARSVVFLKVTVTQGSKTSYNVEFSSLLVMVAVFTPYRTGEYFWSSASLGFSVLTCSKTRTGGTYFVLPQPRVEVGGYSGDGRVIKILGKGKQGVRALDHSRRHICSGKLNPFERKEHIIQGITVPEHEY